MRSLVRCRETLTREILKSRHYVLKLLLARGHVYRVGSNWTQAHWAWLRGVKLEGADAITLQTYLELLEYKLIQRNQGKTLKAASISVSRPKAPSCE
ncbi:MAG: hypothetical protein ACYTGN_14070 [Planctomycetota bacterium]